MEMKWISVDESLPKYDEKCLFCHFDKIYIGWREPWAKGNGFVDTEFIERESVNYWMNLPPLPELKELEAYKCCACNKETNRIYGTPVWDLYHIEKGYKLICGECNDKHPNTINDRKIKYTLKNQNF